MCTAPGCCCPNRWRCVKAVPWWNGRESRSHAAQSFRASTQPFDFRTSMNRARNVSPIQQYPSSFHPSRYLCPSALTAEDTESYSHRKTWSPIKLTRCSHSGLWIALSERASILLPAHPKPFVYIKSPVFCPLVWSTYQYIQASRPPPYFQRPSLRFAASLLAHPTGRDRTLQKAFCRTGPQRKTLNTGKLRELVRA